MEVRRTTGHARATTIRAGCPRPAREAEAALAEDRGRNAEEPSAGVADPVGDPLDRIRRLYEAMIARLGQGEGR